MTLYTTQINLPSIKPVILKSRISTISFTETIDTIANWALTGYSGYVCVANVHMMIEAYNSPSFANVLEQAGLVTPDGMPLVIALRMLYNIRQDRIAGMDLMPALIAKAATHSIPIFFYGSSKEVIDHIVSRALTEHPKLVIAGAYAPPFRPLTHEEQIDELNRINSSGSRIVFVSLGCPKQERWMANYKDKITAVMVGVGGAFPVYAGIQSRAPSWMQRYSLEWLYRLYQEPFRLFKRYTYTNSLFLLLLLIQLLKSKLQRNN